MTLNGRPTTDAQWAREVEKRLRALERPRMVTLGPWAVSVSPINSARSDGWMFSMDVSTTSSSQDL